MSNVSSTFVGVNDAHRQILEASAISPAIANERGYRTITAKSDLEVVGFGPSQRTVPALLIPMYGPDGSIVNHQSRPDTPRKVKGKAVKYETPAGSRMKLDIHPSMRKHLDDPWRPLFITEGIRKGDAAATMKLCCAVLLGVYNFLCTNAKGGKVVLPEFEYIALNDRKVYIVYDSDVTENVQVQRARMRLAAFLQTKGARAHYIDLPPGPGGVKMGLDDFFAAGHTVKDLMGHASEQLKPDQLQLQGDSGYVETAAGFVFRKAGGVEQLLTNFTARIAEEIVIDDGATKQRKFAVEGQLEDGTPLERLSVPAEDFNAMGWVVQWGARAYVKAGYGVKDRAREAVQEFSGQVPVRLVYAHTGWRQDAQGMWMFLHADGAIGPNGPVPEVETSLHHAASLVKFPAAATDDDIRRGIRASLDLLELGSDRIMVPILGAVYRSVLCEMLPLDLTLNLTGPTGVFKSELSALAMQHVGAEFRRIALPAQWSATANAIERMAFEFKDVPFVIDDYAPTGSLADVRKLQGTADRVVRSVGNRGARARMNRDLTLRPDFPPRGVVIVTGEDVPPGQSLRARQVIIEVGKGDIDPVRLTHAQKIAAEGLLVAGFAGFIRSIARNFTGVEAAVAKETARFRKKALRGGVHARTPDAMANLALGWNLFLRFAIKKGVINELERVDLEDRVWTALGVVAEQQRAFQIDEDPTTRFLVLLGSAIASGEAFVASKNGEEPRPNPGAWGWQISRSGKTVVDDSWRSRGKKVGWIDGDDLYLELNAAVSAVHQVALGSGNSITVGPKTLAKRLHEKGVLKSITGPGDLQVRLKLEGEFKRAYHISTKAIFDT